MLKFESFKIFRGSNLLFLGLLLSFCTFLLSSCFKNDTDDINLEEELRKQQQAYLEQLGKDTVLIKQYLQDQGFTDAKRTASGLFYREVEPGMGKSPVTQKQVTVQYRLRSLEGETLDQGVLPPFIIDGGGVVPGFNEGVKLMKVGGKSQLFLPSGLAYGPGGSPPRIQANQVLIFDVELLEAKQ